MRPLIDQQGRLQKCRLYGDNEISTLIILKLCDRKALIHRTSFERRAAPTSGRQFS
jgi:hypothetical protein